MTDCWRHPYLYKVNYRPIQPEMSVSRIGGWGFREAVVYVSYGIYFTLRDKVLVVVVMATVLSPKWKKKRFDVLR